MDQKVVIIGCGPCGLSLLHAFQSEANKGVQIPEIVCFEKQENCGGLWNLDWRTGLDQNGEPIHCSMYQHLWSNGPKECLEFADYSFEEHFGKNISSFPPREILRDYVLGRVRRSGVDMEKVKFSTVVRNVEFNEESQKFTITVYNLLTLLTYYEICDYVIVASGHFSLPNVPQFEGFDQFPGRIIHSHDFRNASEFEGQNLLIVGNSYSGEDIALQCAKFGATSVTISYRTQPTGFHWPDQIQEVPSLVRVEGKTAYFSNDTSKEVDAIILCTGYLHRFPFMGNDLRLRCQNALWIPNLYKGLVWMDNTKLFYIGMHDQYYTFNWFDAQAWYIRDIILGRILLPSKEDMEVDSQAWQQKFDSLKSYEDEIYFQGDHMKALLAETDYNIDVDAMNEIFVKWEKDKHENIATYRDQTFRSVVTGTMSPAHHTSWFKNMDDSKQGFLSSAI